MWCLLIFSGTLDLIHYYFRTTGSDPLLFLGPLDLIYVVSVTIFRTTGSDLCGVCYYFQDHWI